MTQVIRTGGSIGMSNSCIVKVFENHEEAKELAKRLRNQLTPGEKSYYGIRYLIKKVK